MNKLLLALQEWWKSFFITPTQAQECADALRTLHADVHAKVDALPTPEEIFARWKQEGLI